MGKLADATRVAAAIALWSAVALLWRDRLEATMVGHALVQLPLLVAAGALLVPRGSPRLQPRAHPYSLPVLLIGLFTLAIWMLPRSLDGALSDPTLELAKVLSLPLFAGTSLRWSWPRLPPVTRSFVLANLISMLLVLGWLYHAAPRRVCNYYLLDEQQQLGSAYLTLAALLVAIQIPRLFLGREIPRIHAMARDDSPGRDWRRQIGSVSNAQ